MAKLETLMKEEPGLGNKLLWRFLQNVADRMTSLSRKVAELTKIL